MRASALLAVFTLLVLLIYAPIIAGKPAGWSLYAYWAGIGLAALAVAAAAGWGVSRSG